jgi:fido (protein-threonine AMPylation protein)
MKATQTNNYKESQRELSAGVLKQAEQDLRSFYGAASTIERELYLDVYRWVMSDDSVVIFPS